MTSSAWVPTEPGAPRIATFFIRPVSSGLFHLACFIGPASSADDVQRDVIRGGQREDEGVEAVHDPAVTGQDRTEVLDPEVALDHRFDEVTEWRHDRDDDAEQQPVADAA